MSALRRATATLARLREQQAEATEVRNAAIIWLKNEGMTYEEIARIAGLTRGRVAQIVQQSA